MKTVYLEPAWKLPLSSQIFLSHPPQGYRFVAPQTLQEQLFTLAASRNSGRVLQSHLTKMVPLWLTKSYLERFRRIPKEAELTYSLTHLILRKEPWVLDMLTELPCLLAGGEDHLNRYRGLVRRVLTSPYCKKIICWVEAGRQALLAQVGRELEEKIEVVYGAVPPRRFVKEHRNEKVKLLMVNSGNINSAEHFFNKGGREVVEAFIALSQRYGNLELVIRSGMPQGLKNKYAQIRGLRIIDKVVPWAELEQEWKTADIFILPNHCNTPAAVFIDAMSYELPIVTTDLWANPEIVAEGRNGFLVPRSVIARYWDGAILHLSSAEYKKVVNTTDPQMVHALVDRLSLLIENPELRRQMGKAARWEVERGKFSIENRNEKLKRIFDQATGARSP